jgi:Fe-S-cluster-containing dehydrogenase component
MIMTKDAKTQYTLLIDLDRCVGCKACQLACKVENNVDYGIFWTQMNSIGPEGEFPKLDYFYFPKQCQHCENPLCVSVCPTKATYQTDEGIVLVDQDKCFGCQYCIWACPYGVRTLNKAKGMVEKCILCAGRVERGELPACVVGCEGDCRYFGDANDPLSDVSIYLAEHQGRAFRVHPEFGTKPSVIYLKPRKGANKL